MEREVATLNQMARHESDREDILREATALVERAELMAPGEAEPVVVGFRSQGAASVFFGGDPVYQFNAAGELRRAYAAGLLYKAEQGRLVALQRERTASEVQLVRQELTAEESARFAAGALARLQRLAAAIAAGEVRVSRQWPAEGDVLRRVSLWLVQLPPRLAVAGSAGVR